MLREEVNRRVDFFCRDFGMKTWIRVQALVGGSERIEELQVAFSGEEFVFELHQIEYGAVDGVGVVFQTLGEIFDCDRRAEKSQRGSRDGSFTS